MISDEAVRTICCQHSFLCFTELHFYAILYRQYQKKLYRIPDRLIRMAGNLCRTKK